jgi:hypothetical protein
MTHYELRDYAPPQVVKMTVVDDGKYLKIVPPAKRVPFSPPIDPSEDSYKYLAMINRQNQIVQMALSENGLVSAYYTFSYDAKKNPVKVDFTYTDTNGSLAHLRDLAGIEQTKYVRSPFNNPMYALVNALIENFGVYPYWSREFGVNMPVKVSFAAASRGGGPSSRFGYEYYKMPSPLVLNFVYHYNAKKLPTTAVGERYFYQNLANIDSVRFEYQ